MLVRLLPLSKIWCGVKFAAEIYPGGKRESQGETVVESTHPEESKESHHHHGRCRLSEMEAVIFFF